MLKVYLLVSLPCHLLTLKKQVDFYGASKLTNTAVWLMKQQKLNCKRQIHQHCLIVMYFLGMSHNKISYKQIVTDNRCPV